MGQGPWTTPGPGVTELITDQRLLTIDGQWSLSRDLKLQLSVVSCCNVNAAGQADH